MRFSLIKKKNLSKELHESGSQEVAACRHDATKNMGSPCGWDVSHGEVLIEETDGSCGMKNTTIFHKIITVTALLFLN